MTDAVIDIRALSQTYGQTKALDAVSLQVRRGTVYGLVASADREDYAARVYRLKGRDETQPTALLTDTLESLLECLPELRGRSEVIVRALLPGPYTLILPNPARRFRWLTGIRTDAIGVRVPDLPQSARRVVEAVGCLMATSAVSTSENA